MKLRHLKSGFNFKYGSQRRNGEQDVRIKIT